MSMDRREPDARYVLLADQDAQEHLAHAAELAYQRLVQADNWGAGEMLAMPSVAPAGPGGPAEPAATKRRGLRRRPTEVPPPWRSLDVTAAVAAAARTALEVPARIAAQHGCAGESGLATSMSEVILELVGDIAAEPLAEQYDHPAYRQTVRLAAELSALDQALAEHGCADTSGCVAVRGPGAWGRRREDVEVTEVVAVLQQLARH